MMIRYECSSCDMAATCVQTTSSALAWQDHMDTHDLLAEYRAWVWEIIPLLWESDSP